jgi:hypothetical protein
MKKIYILTLGLIGYLNHLSAQNYTLTTTSQMAPGIIYQKYTMTTPHPQEIHVLQMDLKDPTVKIQSAKAGNLLNSDTLTVKAIAASKDVNEQYHNIIGAVNGDFFVTSGSSTGNPQNLMAPDGQIFAEKFGTAKTIFGVSNDNNPFIALRAPTFSVKRGGVSRAIQKVNGSRTTDTLVLYNQYKGTSTGQDATGTEVKLGLAPGAVWLANCPVKCVVIAKQVNVTGMSFSSSQAVLSGKGTESTYLQGFSVGDTVTVQMDVATGVSNIAQVMGGYPRITTSGVNTAHANLMTEGAPTDSLTLLPQDTTHNPHTAVGISQDKRFMYMVVVDGRSPATRYGMSLTELSDLMIYLGAYDAMNLDGGGSSTLVANNVVKNIPSNGYERGVGTALLSYSATQLMDGFEANEGHFNQAPTYTAGTQYTVGISTSSTMDRVTTSSCSGVGSEKAVLIDDASVSTPWTVRLLSGSGIPSNNVKIASKGTISFWLKTSTAQAGATVQVWFDDSDGAEASPSLSILNDGQWHQYSFDLANYNGTTITTGNGQLDADSVTLDAIVLKQVNTSSTWTVYFDDVSHDLTGSGTKVSSQNVLLDDFEAGVGHFDHSPTSTVGTQYTAGISTSSTLQRVTTDKHRGLGGLKAVLIDSAGSTDWVVRLMSGSGLPSNNIQITSDGTLSFWMKTSTANTGATVQVWFDDTDGNEVSPALSVINDGQWHLYNFDLDNFNGTSVTTGNGQLDGSLITLDAIVLKQPNTSSTWTVYFDDVMHLATGANPGTSSQATRKQETKLQNVVFEKAVVYPNPNNGNFYIDLPLAASSKFKVQIISSDGKIVFSKYYSGGKHTINVAGITPGYYVVNAQSKSFHQVSKIIIQ